MRAAGELISRLVKHRGSMDAVRDELQADLEWDKFRARHGLVDVDVEDVAEALTDLGYTVRAPMNIWVGPISDNAGDRP